MLRAVWLKDRACWLSRRWKGARWCSKWTSVNSLCKPCCAWATGPQRPCRKHRQTHQ
jgi:hypothetical protein